MLRLRALVVVAVVGAVAVGALSAACGATLDAQAPFTLHAQDPALLSEAKVLLFSFSKDFGCADIVDNSPRQLGQLLADEAPPLQPLCLVPDADICDPIAASSDHVFGKVEPGVDIAYFALATSTTDLDESVQLGDFEGTVFAVGCSDFNAPAGSRTDLPMTLFPVGLR